MTRVVVLGGLGQFGRAAADELHRLGLPVRTASRSTTADLQFDANDAASIRSQINRGDLVIDAAGPFHARSTALVESAIDVGFGIIDLNDSLDYAEKVVALEPKIESAGIRVLSSASTVSAVAAAIVQHSGIISPQRLTAFLAPASRHTANAGSALSLIRAVGRPVRVFLEGRLQTRNGWSQAQSFTMPPPIGTIRARLFESADALYLPRLWPSLLEVGFYVDTNTAGVNALLCCAARVAPIRRFLESQVNLATWFARRFGSSAGGIGYEIEDSAGLVARYAVVAEKNSFIAAVAPAVLAARAIVENRFAHLGLVLPDLHCDAQELFAFMATRGIEVRRAD